MPDAHDITRILQRAREGDEGAAEALFPVVYGELRAIARSFFSGQATDQTLQPTALVHEAYLKLIDQHAAGAADRAHFMALAARAMRHILIDHARARNAARRGGGQPRLALDPAIEPGISGELDLVELDDLVERLAAVDERQARIVEMRFFAGLTVEETAQALGVSPRTVQLDWRMAKAWLSHELSGT